jgi:hypothetical protein
MESLYITVEGLQKLREELAELNNRNKVVGRIDYLVR